MANSDLLKPVDYQSTRLDATVLPPGFSQAFTLYLLQQNQSGSGVAAKANQAAQGAYDAQQRNDEQDTQIDDIQGSVSGIQQQVSDIRGRVTTAEGKITNLQNDYVSKGTTASQSLASPINVATSYSVNGLKVVGARITGFPDLGGTGYYGTFNADLTQSISATYVQAESQALATQIQTARRRIKALEDALKAHGLISI